MTRTLALRPKHTPNRVVLKDRIYIEQGIVPKLEIEKRYRVSLYDDVACSRCDNLPDRHNGLCDQCPAFGGSYNLHRQEERNGRLYWSVPIGDIQYVRDELLGDKLDDLDIRNGIKKHLFDHPIEWRGRLYKDGDVDDKGNPRPNQEELVETWLETKNGLIRAKPRSGKTVMAVNLSCRLGVKTIIVAHQHELLKQFRWTYVGHHKKGKRPMTNARELEKQHGMGSVVKIITKMSDFDSHPDIALITYQSFIHDLERIKKYVNGRYTFLIVDEAHQGSADQYSRVLAALDMPYRLQLSATDKRKDGREVLTERLMGPVVAESKTFTLIPEIHTYQTSTAPPTEYKSWHGCINWVATSKQRNIEIVQQVFKDLRDGHTSIIIPVFWRGHQDALVKLINRQAEINRRKKGEKWPKDLAQALHGQANRQHVLDRVDSGKPCVLVAINGMIKQGIDLATPTSLHLVIPTSAVREIGAPMFYQLSMRVCTPMPGKRQPKVTLWVDHLKLFRGCLTGLFWNEIVPGLKKENFKYRLAPGVYDQMASLNKKAGAGGFTPRAMSGGGTGGWA